MPLRHTCSWVGWKSPMNVIAGLVTESRLVGTNHWRARGAIVITFATDHPRSFTRSEDLAPRASRCQLVDFEH